MKQKTIEQEKVEKGPENEETEVEQESQAEKKQKMKLIKEEMCRMCQKWMRTGETGFGKP
ncbi:hypothetical protein HA385_24225 [Escherichia coli]|nr:hypothetical protein [Escherichia coli]